MRAADNNQRAVAAFFDLDRTLIDGNSGLLYARFERQQGNISLVKLARVGVWGVLYHLSLLDVERAFRAGLSHYVGVEEDVVRERTRAFFDAEVSHRLAPGAREAVESHRARGHRLVMLTSATTYLAEIASEAWGLDDSLSNRFESDARGRLTGDMIRPICYGPGKVALAERWAAREGVDLERSYFYSDSYSDVPMLERVGNPRVVRPDPRLRAHARLRRWPILEWRQRTGRMRRLLGR